MRSLNHVSIEVKDVQRSVEFYRRVFGLKVKSREGTPGDPNRVLKNLTDQGVKARMRTRGESKEIFVTDPDNISVQLTDVSYCGGAGPFGTKG